MIDKRTIFEIHRLKDFGWTERRIAREIRLGRNSVKKYLENPQQVVSKRSPKPSKLDPFREIIDQFFEQDPMVKAPVVLQRLQSQGFDGKITIVRDYLQKVRGKIKHREPFIRFESSPGQQMQIDWGHFGHLSYGQDNRRLYALAVTESYSRLFYVEFTHSQRQEALHQSLLNAFSYFGGTSRELLVDNMLTAVTERQGALIRFNEAFLDFLRPFKIVPAACNVRSPHEKGKIENIIKYVRYNFWPLRSFADLNDVQRQILDWLEKVASVRIHQTTGQSPKERFSQFTLRALPEPLPDCRETATVFVHKDFAVRFDANAYTVPPWLIGKKLTLKADKSTVTVYHHQKPVATHQRSWRRKQRIELPAHVEQVKKMKKRLWQDKHIALFSSLGQEARDFLQALADANQPIKKNVSRLLRLKDEYGAHSLIQAIKKSLIHRAYGAHYIENILYQEMTPQQHHPPVKLKDKDLNHIRPPEPSLSEYDAYILKKKRRKKMIESIIEKFKLLKLKACADNITSVIEGAKEKNWSTLQIIEHLIDLELEIREKNRIALRFKQSRLLEKPTIDQFDFNFHISRKKQKNRILNLMDLEFIKKKKDVILIGNPGVGKSFLAKCIAYVATQSSVKVLFTTAMDMINHLIAAEADHSLLKKLHYYQSPALLVIDEMGYLPLGTQGSNLFFQVISARHERCSSVITTNLPFAQWGNIFDSTTVATAIDDRLVYNSEILIMEGSSYRKRAKRN